MDNLDRTACAARAPSAYRPLDFNKSDIRLVRMKPSPAGRSRNTASSNPDLQLIHVTLETAPPYKALSYRWGCYPGDKEITIDGHPLGVSNNLYDCLSQGAIDQTWNCQGLGLLGNRARAKRYLMQRVSPPSCSQPDSAVCKGHWLWIDQLCIDQTNIDEKNHQVAQMGRIYSQATEVLVWLGWRTDGTDQAAQVLRRASASWLWSAVLSHVRSIINIQSLNKRYMIRAFRGIAANPYWGRLWIIQEFVLARNVIIMSGSQCLDVQDLRELIRDVNQIARDTEASLLARIWPYFMARNRRLSHTWQHVMEMSKNAQCKDARDRVYGMLSLVQPEVRIQVDYAADTKLIRERVVDKEFAFVYGRPYSVKAQEEFADKDFEIFLNTLSSALGLNDQITGLQTDWPTTPLSAPELQWADNYDGTRRHARTRTNLFLEWEKSDS